MHRFPHTLFYLKILPVDLLSRSENWDSLWWLPGVSWPARGRAGTKLSSPQDFNSFTFFELMALDISNFISEKGLFLWVGENCFSLSHCPFALLWSIFVKQCQLWNIMYFRCRNCAFLEGTSWCLPEEMNVTAWVMGAICWAQPCGLYEVDGQITWGMSGSQRMRLW